MADEVVEEMVPLEDVVVGKTYWIQEAFSILIGTCKKVSPFSITLDGKDAVWVRDLGQMSEYIASGTVTEFHAITRDVVIKDHAIRYMFETPHASPAAGGTTTARRRRS